MNVTLPQALQAFCGFAESHLSASTLQTPPKAKQTYFSEADIFKKAEYATVYADAHWKKREQRHIKTLKHERFKLHIAHAAV